MMPLARLARVIKVYPDSQTADVRFNDNGAPGWRLPISTLSTGDTGSFDIPNPETSQNPFPTGEREAMAICVTLGNNKWIIVGFLPPTKRQSMFADGRTVSRHSSDIYTSTDQDGNFQWTHPSGAWVRVGTPDKEDLTGQDVDRAFKIKRNTASAPTITVGGPWGALTIGHEGAINLQTSNGISLTCTKLTVTGDVEVTGDVTADGVSLKHHVHGGVTPGGSNTGEPVA